MYVCYLYDFHKKKNEFLKFKNARNAIWLLGSIPGGGGFYEASK